MLKDLEAKLRFCEPCQRVKSTSTTARAPMEPIEIGAPGQIMGHDIIGPLPITGSGNKYILVVIDYFTKWVEAYPMVRQDAVNIAYIFVKEWLCRYGMPSVILTDRGTQFESEIFSTICKNFGIE